MRQTLLIFRDNANRTSTVHKCSPEYWCYASLDDAVAAGQAQMDLEGNKYDGFYTMGLEHFIKMQVDKLGKDLIDPGRYGSDVEKRAESQPHFILLAQDNLAPPLVAQWILGAREAGASKEKIDRAGMYLADMVDWRNKNPTDCKFPD